MKRINKKELEDIILKLEKACDILKEVETFTDKTDLNVENYSEKEVEELMPLMDRLYNGLMTLNNLV